MDKIVCIFIYTVLITVCTAGDFEYLSASPKNSSSIASHDLYPRGRYDPGVDKTWVIAAPEGYVIGLWTKGVFEIEYGIHCDYDHLTIKCGESGEGDWIARLCGNDGLDAPVNSSSNTVTVNFYTDHSVERSGFRLLFQAFAENESESKSAATIAVITVGVMSILVVIVIVVVCICCCVAAGRPFIARRQQPYVQNYPLQTYPSTLPAIVTSPTSVSNQNQTGTQGAAIYPIPAQLPSNYLPPYQPPSESSAPPSYESFVSGGIDKNLPPAYDNKTYFDTP